MNSDLWARIYSNVTGLPIKRTVNPEAATTGSAILGGVAAGAFSDINDGANRTVKFKEDVLPDKNDFDKYAAYVDKYISTYNALKDTNPELNELAKL
jgi:sugar (pentulose or hexulose) kinase